MANERSAVSRDYFAGLFDANGTVRLNPQKDEQQPLNHRFDCELRINSNQSDEFVGLVSGFLEAEDINYIIEDTYNGTRYVTITWSESIQKLSRILEGRPIKLAEQLAFLAEVVIPMMERDEMQNPREFHAATLQFAELRPIFRDHGNRKYTPEYFQDYFERQFDIELENGDPLNVPDVSYPEEPPIEYFAGLFDTHSQFTLQVSQSAQYRIGYKLAPKLVLFFSSDSTVFLGYVRQFLAHNSIDYNSQDHNNNIQINIKGADNLEKLIELIAPHLYMLYPQAEFLYEQGLPAYRDGYHHTKQGFYELLAAMEEASTTPARRSKKYTAEYFAKTWSDEIEEFD